MKRLGILLITFWAIFHLPDARCLPNVENGDENRLLIWTGKISNNWETAGNWSPAFVPGATDDLIIPIGGKFDPVISQSDRIISRNLTIQPIGNDSKNTLGKCVSISNGEVVIDGNLKIKAGATLVIDSNGALTINGSLTILTGGSLIIESGGSLITNGTVTGIATIKREVSGNLKWHLLSSSVSSQLILDGVFAPLKTDFLSTPVTCFDFYKFNSACEPVTWINLRSSNGSLNIQDFGTFPEFAVTRGYLVAYSNDCFPKTKVFSGTPNTGNQTLVLSNGNPSCIWDLLGNPYPSAFQWSGVLGKSNLTSGYYYVWNEAKTGGAGYEAYLDADHCTEGVNGNIPAMQGFFVKTAVPGSSLVLPNSARIHDSDHWLKHQTSQLPNKIKISVSDNLHSDDTFLIFEPTGNSGQDWFDALKIFSLDNQVPQIYSIPDKENKNLISSLPEISQPVSVPLGLVIPSYGEYYLKATRLESLSSGTGVILEDIVTGVSQNLLTNPGYTFTGSPDDPGQRFVLHLFKSESDPASQENPIHIFTYGKTIYISSPDGMPNGRLEVCNIVGQNILSVDLKNIALNEVITGFSDGYYIVKVRNDSFVKTTKVYLK